MIIDCDVHITPTGEGIMTDELISRMDRYGVDKALVWLQPPYMRETAPLNEYVYSACKAHPDRLLGFGWVDPHLGIDRAVDDIKRCIEEYGFYGVKLNGAQNNFPIDDPQLAMPLIDEIAKYNVPIAFHCGADSFENTHPFRVAKIAKRYPEMKVLMVHMGGAGVPSLASSAIEFASECPNITMIGSAVQYRSILKAVKTLGADRICFGSDTPFAYMRVELAAWRALLDGEVTDKEREMLLGGNIAKILDIE